jgi:lantibiotic modifying enzyme
MGGSAGAIIALVAMSRSVGCLGDHELAISIGEELCRAAARHDNVWTWDPEVASGHGTASAPLTGLSHGAAGIALALLELHAATRRQEFLEGATGAFAYEDSLFDPVLGNWPDLRGIDVLGESPPAPRYVRAWCHGAPGIALARLRASALDSARAEAHLAIARAAIDTTFRAIEENITRPGSDASLCHGMAGLLEIALEGGRILNEPTIRDRVIGAATVLIERHHSLGDWPSGFLSGGPNPSLMLGLAGIGYFFLRLQEPECIPSVLLLNS